MMKKTKTGSRRILSFLLAVAFILLQTACAGYVPEEPRQDSGYESFAETFAETAESSTAAQSESFEAVGSSNAGGDAGEGSCPCLPCKKAALSRLLRKKSGCPV